MLKQGCCKPECKKPADSIIFVNISASDKRKYYVHHRHIGWISQVKIMIDKKKTKSEKLQVLDDVGLGDYYGK